MLSKTTRELRLSRNSWCIRSRHENLKLDLESAYDRYFLQEVNSVDIQNPCSDYINEIFLYYFVKYKELDRAASEIGRSSYSYDARLTSKSLLFSLNSQRALKIGPLQAALFYMQALCAFSLSLTFSIFLSIALPFIILVKNRKRIFGFKGNFIPRKRVFLVRSKSGFSRAKSFIEENAESLVVVDDHSGLRVSGQSIYSLLRSSNAPEIYARSLLYTLRDFVSLYKDAKSLLGIWFAFSVFCEYWKRIPQKALYEACLMKVLDLLPENAEVFSGEKEDRFALLQTRCCAQRKLHLICLPHGLEYGFRFPGGLCGESFYCFSENAKRTLEALYSSKKFIYSGCVLDKMLGIKPESLSGEVARICFFTEPRDPKVNLEILDYLAVEGIKCSLKLHPLEDPCFYTDRYRDIEIIEDLEDALKSSVCLARKSTILLEAVQRGRRSVAVLVAKKDKFYVDNLFPSLSSEKIVKVMDLRELADFLK
jgi:hypothetical protein